MATHLINTETNRLWKPHVIDRGWVKAVGYNELMNKRINLIPCDPNLILKDDKEIKRKLTTLTSMRDIA